MIKVKTTPLLAVILLSSCFILKAQDIRINEAVSSNSEYLDEDGDTPDWLEIHNYGTTTVSLLDWGLTDDDEELDQWKFPDINLQPNEYLFIWASSKDRSEISYGRTVVNQGDSHRYLIPAAELPADWNTSGFDDSAWNEGPSGFGFGDGDDATTLATGTASVFTRTAFTVTDLDKLYRLVLDVDYDDGFVAYINGVEVARANINGTPPAFDSGTIIDHEAQMYNGGTPDRFLIENVNDFLVEGENILAIQGHNTNNTSSDFTLIPFLSAVYDSSVSIGINPPEILGLSGGNLHTNFKISSKSENLTISDASGTIISQMLVEGLQSNISLGTSNISGDLVFFVDTTPGAQNSGQEYSGVLGSDIEFSHDGGLVAETSLELILSGNTGTQIIRYTLDGTEPNESSPEYSSPINISSNTVVRAKLFDVGSLPSYIVSKSYIFNANHEIDVVFLTTDAYNLFDEEYGIYAYGDSYDLNSPYRGANFWEDWERPVHFSFLNKDTKNIEIEFNAGIKIFGGYSRANDQRSFSIFARGQYGTSKMEYPFFDSVEYDEFEAVVLRNSGNDWLSSSMKDAALTSLMQGSGLDFQAFNPVAAYINDEYWGMYNLREKTNEHMLASKHDVDADDINLLGQNAEIIEGDNTEYLELINYVNTTDLANDNNFKYVEDRVDLVNYALYQSTQIFFNNTDWPGNNIKFWNHSNGKWRWILYDTDFGFGPPWDTDNYDENTLSFAMATNGPSWPNPPWSTLLFRKLTDNISFRNQFVNRYADELNTRFLPDNVKDHFEAVFQMIQPEITAHYNRWGGNPNDSANFKEEMKVFAENRPSIVKEHIKTVFSLPNHHAITISNTDISQGYVEVNDNLLIQETSWSGDYFETVPIKLTAIPESGYTFSHWTGASTATTSEIEIDLQNAIEITPHFVIAELLDALVINEINYKSSDEFDPDDWVELYNPNDVNVDVSNWVLKDDDDEHGFVFPVGTQIIANGFLILAKNAEDFSAVFPTIENVVGDIGFGFGGADAVRLYNASEELQGEVSYDSDSWADCANGLGPTLELISPELDSSLPESWDCTNTNGSPNMHNDDVLIDDGIYLVINEINYKSSDDFDADDWIELYNPNDEPVDLSNWVLKDDKEDNTFVFPEGISIESNGYLVVVKSSESFMAAYPTIENIIGDIDFGFGGSDAVRLFNANAFLRDEVYYTSEAPWPICADGLGPTMELISPELDNSLAESWDCTNTNGSPNMHNDDVLIDDGIYLVINEINYKSSDDFDAGDWIELYNPNDDEVDLFNWVLKDDKDDNVFAFPDGTSIASQGYLVVVKDSEAFMAAYPTISNIVGDFDFGFGGSDAVRLFNADAFLRDEVYYTSETPWPICADGLGPTMELISPELDNSLPESWECTNTIGTPNLANNEEFPVEEEPEEPEPEGPEEPVEVSEIIMYPNPTESMLHINVTGQFQINIFDITGKKVFEATDTSDMDLSVLSAGVYMVEYLSEDKKEYERIIVK